MSTSNSYFIFNGIDSRKYRLYVTGDSVYSVNAFEYSANSVDGREGDIIYSHGRHANVDVTYHVEAHGNGMAGFRKNFDEFRRKLSACEGYCQLTDGYYPDYIREGYLKSIAYASQKGTMWMGGEIDITFSCKPQMYLAAGMEYVEYPLLVRGTCTETGLEDATGIAAKSRVGPFSAVRHSRMYFRLIGCTEDEEVMVTKVSTSAATWSSCSQETITVPASGAWVSVDRNGYAYFWFEFGNRSTVYDDILWGDGQYLECVWDDTDDDPWRYASQGIVIVNGSDNLLQPQYQMVDQTTYTGQWIMSIQHMEEDEIVLNDSWILEHPDSTDFNFDCERQTVTGDDGKSLAKYVKFTTDGDGTIFSQWYPQLHPGLNLFDTYANQTTGWTHDQLTPYVLRIKTNEWTV